MRRLHPWGLVLAFAGSAGCVTVVNQPLDRSQIAQMREQLDGRRADVALAPSQTADLLAPPPRLRGDIFIEEAMVRVVESQEREHRQPLLEVREIDADHSGRGAVIGALAGVAAGIVLGVVAGLVVGEDCSNAQSPDDCVSARKLGTLTAITVGLPAGAVGAGLGALIGIGPVWRFSASPSTAATTSH